MDKIQEQALRDRGVLLDGERLDDLQTSGYRLIQRQDAFRFGTDSVLLADFANPKRNTLAADLGAGTGAIAHLMLAHQPDIQIHAVELQAEIADMLKRSVQLNGIEEKILVHHMDMRSAYTKIGLEKLDLCVCNPPYGKAGGALLNENAEKRIARHEGDLTNEDICMSAARLLRFGGRFAVIYPASRAFEMMRAMDKCRLAPKHIRMVQAKIGRAPKFILLDAVKGGGEMLHWLPPLILYNEDGSPTAEWKRIYRVKEGK